MAVATEYNGFKKVLDSSTSELAVYSKGQKRVEFGNTTLTTEGANTAALLFGYGTSTTPVSCGTTASKNFAGFWTSSAATSGDSRGLYWRHYIAGAGGDGEAVRAFTTINNVAAAGGSHGIHASLSFGTTGTTTGLGCAGRFTLHIANQATQAGTLCAVMAEINSDGSTSDPAGSLLSVFRVVNGGDATGLQDVDTDCFLFDFSGWSSGSGNFWYDNTSNAADDFWKIRKPDGTTAYLISSDSTTFA